MGKVIRCFNQGYIGSSVLERLQNYTDASTFEITAIVRSPQKAEKFRQFGVNAVVGSFDDADLLEDLTAAADVVFDTVRRNTRIPITYSRKCPGGC